MTVRTTVRDTLLGFGGGGVPDLVASGVVVSVERIAVLASEFTDTSLILDLTKDQAIGQCVPFITQQCAWSTNTDVPWKSVAAEVIDNAGTPAVKLFRANANTDDLYIHVTVLEFVEDINVTKLSAEADHLTDWDATLAAAVDLDYTFAVGTFKIIDSSGNSGSDDCDETFVRLGFADSTTVNMQRAGTPAELLEYVVYVIEDTTDGELFNVQSFSGTAYQTSIDESINEVVMEQSVLIANWTSNNTGNSMPGQRLYANLESTTNVEIVAHASNSRTMLYSGFVVEFQVGVAVQRGVETIDTPATGVVSINVDLEVVDAENSWGKMTSQSAEGAAGYVNSGIPNTAMHRLIINEAGDQMYIGRHSYNSANEVVVPWEVAEFALADAGGGGGGGNSALADLKTDLVAWWEYDESSFPVVDSHSSYEMVATGGMTLVEGIIGNCMESGGPTSSTDISPVGGAAALALGGIGADFSVVAVIKLPDDGLYGTNPVFMSSSDVGGGGSYYLQYHSTNQEFVFGGQSGSTWLGVYADDFGTPTAGDVLLIYGQYDSTTEKFGIAINGGTLNEDTGPTTANVKSGHFFHVSELEFYNGYFLGQTHITAKWDRLLTSDEQSAILNNGALVEYSDLS